MFRRDGNRICLDATFSKTHISKKKWIYVEEMGLYFDGLSVYCRKRTRSHISKRLRFMARRKDPDTYILDQNDEPLRCTLKKHTKWMWAQAHAAENLAIVAMTDLGGRMLKTVFTGVDARTMQGVEELEPGHDPLVFMSISYVPMVVGMTVHRRYSRWDDALQGHNEIKSEGLDQ